MKTKQLLSKTLGAALFAAAMLLSSIAFAQVKIGKNPTLLSPDFNLEVESENGQKVRVNKQNGKLSIIDGTQGNGKVLTSDPYGIASWQSASSLVVLARNASTLQPTGPAYTPPIPFVSGTVSAWNASTGVFTAPSTGFYQYNYSLEVLGIVEEIFTIQINPLTIQDGNIRGSSTTWNNRSVGGVKYLLAGETLGQGIYRSATVPFDSNWKVRNVTVSIFKLD